MAMSMVDRWLGRMDRRQMVGQLLCYGFCGTYPHPDVLEMVERYHVAGFRVTPAARKFTRYFGPEHPGTARVTREPELRERVYNIPHSATRYTAVSYARTLNTIRQRSLETGAGVPCYFSLDFEGNVSADCFPPGMVGAPAPLGLAASGDVNLARQVAYLIAVQLKAIGVDWVHSPVLDVNTTPNNPEIGTRSFGPDPDAVTKFGLATLEGYRDGQLIGTGKHFPGRGHSADDAHFGVPVIGESPQRMREVHLAPYRALIEAGLPAIMLAHSEYPSLDGSGTISTLSRPIITELLREEMGFDGVIITDSFTMGGLVARYDVAEAAVRAIEAGVDVILLKDENALRGEVYEAILEAVQTGRIPEQQLIDSVSRVLRTKAEYGLLDGNMGLVDPDEAEAIVHTPWHQQLGRDAARRCVTVLRNKAELIPLPAGKRVLVVEEAVEPMRRHNDDRAHLGALYEALLERGCDCIFTDYDHWKLDDAWETIKARAEHVDIVVFTGWYQRGAGITNEAFDRFTTLCKPVVFVTNSPYQEVVSEHMQSVIVTFSPWVDAMTAAADVLTGRATASGDLGFDPSKTY